MFANDKATNAKRGQRSSKVRHDFGDSKSAHFSEDDNRATCGSSAKSLRPGSQIHSERHFTHMTDAFVVPHDDLEYEEDPDNERELKLVFIKSSSSGVRVKRLEGPGKLHDDRNYKLEKCLGERVTVEGNSNPELVSYDDDGDDDDDDEDDDSKSILGGSHAKCLSEDIQIAEEKGLDLDTLPSATIAEFGDGKDVKKPDHANTQTLMVSMEERDKLRSWARTRLGEAFKGKNRDLIMRIVSDVIEPSNTKTGLSKGDKKSSDVMWLWSSDVEPPKASGNIRSRLKKDQAFGFTSFLLFLPMIDPARYHRLRELLGSRKSPRKIPAEGIHWIKELGDQFKKADSEEWKYGYIRKTKGLQTGNETGDNTSPDETQALVGAFEKILVVAELAERVANNEEDPSPITIPGLPGVLCSGNKPKSTKAQTSNAHAVSRTSRRKGSDSASQVPMKKKKTRQGSRRTEQDIAPATARDDTSRDIKMIDSPYNHEDSARYSQQCGNRGLAFDQRRPHQPPPVSTFMPSPDSEVIYSYPPSANASFSTHNEPPNTHQYHGIVNSGHPDHSSHFCPTVTGSPLHQDYGNMRPMLPGHGPYGYSGPATTPATLASPPQGWAYVAPEFHAFPEHLHTRYLEDGFALFHPENFPQYDQQQ